MESDEDEEKSNVEVKKAKKAINKPNVEEIAVEEIPFTFSVPKSYEELLELFHNRDSKQKAIIIERIIKCNHPQFGKDNKEQLEELFNYLLQHIHDSASVDAGDDLDMIRDGLKTVQALTPFLFDLAKFSPQHSGEAIRSVLQEKFDEFSKSTRNYPGIETVIWQFFTMSSLFIIGLFCQKLSIIWAK